MTESPSKSTTAQMLCERFSLVSAEGEKIDFALHELMTWS